MAIVSLTKEDIAIVDDCFLEAVLAIGNWRTYHSRHSDVRYAKAKVRGVTVFMHRAVWHLAGNAVELEAIDHKNGNGLDNRLENLRASTNSQNQFNRGPTKRNTSGFKGVSFHKHMQKWYARLSTTETRLFLGYFNSSIEAAIAYDEAAKELHGEFACFNLPSRQPTADLALSHKETER